MMHLARFDDMRRLHVCQQQVVEQAIGQASCLEGRGEALANQQRLRGVLEDHRIARHQRRNHRVHRGQIRIVPRRNDQHRAQRLAPDIAPKAVDRCRHHIGQRAFGNRDHVTRAITEAAQLARAIAHRPAHLPRQLRHDLGLHRQHRVDRSAAEGGALADRRALPGQLCGLGRLQSSGDGGVAGRSAFDMDAAVHGRDQLNRCGCGHRVRSGSWKERGKSFVIASRAATKQSSDSAVL